MDRRSAHHRPRIPVYHATDMRSAHENWDAYEFPGGRPLVRGGSFLLGTKSFEIQPTTVTDLNDNPEGTLLLALHRDGDIEIRYEIPVTETTTEDQSITPVLTSTPTMAAADLMALLFHNQEFSALPPSQQEILRKHMTWFTFSE